MKRRYLIVITMLVLLLCGFWPQISKTATGIAQKTIQIVSSANVVLGTGGATAGPAPAEVVNVVDSTNHIIDSFGGNFAAPGPIGGTTSSTGQFTNIAVGASVPTLDGTTGDITATGKFACTTNNTSCVTQADNGAVQRSLIFLDGSNNVSIGLSSSIGGLIFNIPAATNAKFFVNASARLQVDNTTLQAQNGATIQSSGGTAPTATCSGGATGVVVSAGNASCTASVTPFPCCTGSGTGTCSGATNNRGLILTSSSASTNCTITWSANGTWAQAPGCVFTDGSASITPVAFAEGNCGTSTCVFDFASATSKVVQWICM